MRSSGRRNRGTFDYWPGFVDALSSLLIVIIFLILAFVLAQFFLGQVISGKDAALDKLRGQLTELSDMLSLERATGVELRTTITGLNEDVRRATLEREDAVKRLGEAQSERNALTAKLNETTATLDQTRAASESAAKALEDATKSVAADRATIEVQLKQLEQLNRDIAALTQVRADLEKQVADLAKTVATRDDEITALRDASKALEAKLSSQAERTALAQRDVAQRDIRLSELLALGDIAQGELKKERDASSSAQRQVELLNIQIAELREQLGRIELALEIAETKSKAQNVEIADLGTRLNAALASKVEELARYRSEFFGRLRTVLGSRPDIQVVGDRFVFQSEVLFNPGSADLGQAGRTQLAALAGTLKDLSTKIPPDLKWVLQVDGHTDRTPIKTTRFPSNWELSVARAIAVIKFLTAQGISAEHLSAAGFGEFQPIATSDDEAGRKRNRRIELKLTQR